MNLTENPKASDLLHRAATRTDRQKGLMIAYAEGDFSSNINQSHVGKVAYELAQSGHVRLFQKKLTDEPRLYQYIAVIK